MQMLSTSQAKQRLGKVADRALRGEPVLIARKSRLLILQAYDPPEPIPQRPPGYFRDCYTDADVDEINYLASRAAVSIQP